MKYCRKLGGLPDFFEERRNDPGTDAALMAADDFVQAAGPRTQVEELLESRLKRCAGLIL